MPFLCSLSYLHVDIQDGFMSSFTTIMDDLNVKSFTLVVSFRRSMQRTDGILHDTFLLLLHLLCTTETSEDAEHQGDFLVVFCSLNMHLPIMMSMYVAVM